MHLRAQGLLQPLRRQARRGDIVAAIERMQLLQIDSIHVVARSAYLVLHARLGNYPSRWLDDALESGQVAECWAHEANLVPAAAVAWHRHPANRRAQHWAQRNAVRTYAAQRAPMRALLRHIARSGPVRAADFARGAGAGEGKSGWWEWKPEKRWLEAWFALGELMVTRRDGFQRVYDLSANVLAQLDPPLDRAIAPLSAASVREHVVLASVRALGVTRASWIADYYRLRPAVTDAELAPLVASGQLLQVAVRGWKSAAYVHCDDAPMLEAAQRGRLRATHTALLSPFDPVVWDRARAWEMFGFAYTLECYTPAPRRRYGYFVLPILHRGRLVGRLDAKAQRARGIFEIKALFLEDGVRAEPRLLRELAAAIAATARWHATPQVQLDATQPPELAAALRAFWP
ncbi:MAG: crosslink repair DNA glycosylase YcaQ family protein [Rhodanobacter sp.]